MQKIIKKLEVVQNMGLFDRVLRIIIGVVLMGAAALHLQLGDGAVTWHSYAVIVSVYPFLTSILGWDPFYNLFRVRSCSITGGRNQCGTLPYEIDAAMGHDPKPDKAYEHSLESSHHEKQDNLKQAT